MYINNVASKRCFRVFEDRDNASRRQSRSIENRLDQESERGFDGVRSIKHPVVDFHEAVVVLFREVLYATCGGKYRIHCVTKIVFSI
jgi:hypothetical protein